MLVALIKGWVKAWTSYPCRLLDHSKFKYQVDCPSLKFRFVCLQSRLFVAMCVSAIRRGMTVQSHRIL